MPSAPITTSTPADWKALQAEVATILRQCGFSAEIEKSVDTPRGKVELDVYAEENLRGRRYSIVCECKQWKAAIPKTVVHAFRMVVAETGANVGYIIAPSGFQSGSKSAAASTNVQLATWEQFQSQFCSPWLEHYFSPTVTERLDSLVGFTEPFVQRWMCEIPDAEVEVVKALRDRYLALGALVMLFAPYSAFALSEKVKGDRFPNLPIRKHWRASDETKNSLQSEILDAAGYRELLSAMLSVGEKGIAEFLAVKTRNRDRIRN
jgi:hypothetical protein